MVGLAHPELVEDGAEPFHLGLHVALGLVPEVVAVSLFEGDGRRFLQRRDGREADARVRR